MVVLKILSGFYLILFLMLLILGLFAHIKVTKVYKIIITLAAISVGVFGFCLEPNNTLDLFRLHYYIRSLSFSGEGVFQKIWGAQGLLSGDSTQGMIAWNAICYLIQSIGDVHWLSAICSCLTIALLGYIITDYAINNGYSSKAIGLGLCLCFMGMQVQYILSGVRNSLAIAIALYALYSYVYKEGNHIKTIILYILSLTIHPAVLILVVPTVLARLKHQWIFRGIALFTLPLVFATASILRNISFSFVTVTVNRILFYTNAEYQFDRPEMIANALVFITVAFVYWQMLRTRVIEQTGVVEKYYVNAYYLLGFMMIGCIVQRDFALRIGYLMGIAAVPLVCKVLFKAERKTTGSKFLTYGLVFVITVCCLKVFYDSFIVISQWSFN